MLNYDNYCIGLVKFFIIFYKLYGILLYVLCIGY